MQLLNIVEQILEKANFNCSEYSGCFDVVAKRDSDILFLKTLHNIDCLKEEQADNLKTLSNNFGAIATVVGMWSRSGKLKDGVVYERFEIPSITPKTLEDFMHNVHPLLYRFRGGLYVNIVSEKLREKRLKSGMTQSGLAKKLGVTKKSIYEHERQDMLSRYTTARRYQRFLADITAPINLRKDFSYIKKKFDGFEYTVSTHLESIGFSTENVSQSPFNIFAKDADFILSDAENNEKKLIKNTKAMVDFSNVVGKPIIIITKNHIDIDLPLIKEADFLHLEKRDIIKVVKNW